MIKIGKSKYLVYLLIFVTILIFIINIFSANKTNSQITVQSENTINDGWKLNEIDISFPYKIDGIKSETISLVNRLPDNIDEDDAISFLANYNNSEVYIDNKLVYTYGDNINQLFGKMIGNVNCIVPLNSSYANKEIRIEITPYYTQTFEIRDIKLDNINLIYYSILVKNIWRILIIFMLIILGVFFLFLNLYRNFKNITYQKKILIYYFLFVSTIAIWVFCSSDLPQFISQRSGLYSYLSFMSLMLISPIYSGLIENIFFKHKKIFCICKYVGFLFVLLVNILYVFNILDPIQVIIFIHINMAITIIISFIIGIFDFKNKETKMITIGTMIFLSFSVLAIISFYKHPGYGEDALILIIGFIILSIFQLISIINKEIQLVKEISNTQLLIDLAYKDKLTNLGNRAAYEKRIKELRESKKEIFITLIMCDVNYLKQTNDNLGHEEGDNLLKNCAICLKETFSSIGKCYRLGGDEFLVLIENRKDNIQNYLKIFQKNINNFNNKNNTNLSIAFGYAENFLNKENLFIDRELYKEADNNMYKMKKNQHKIKNKN